MQLSLADIEPLDTTGLDAKALARLAAVKLAALTKINRMCGFYPKSDDDVRQRRSGVDDRIIWLVMAVMVSDAVPAWQRAACAAVLDLLFYNWRKGAPTEALGYIVRRDDPEVRAWRSAVLQRDGHACQCCGSNDRLCAHHIVRWADAPELRVAVENGVALCEPCHIAEHTGRLN